MNSKESVVWLDGYMKGITAVGASASNVTYNALFIKLSGDDIMQSYSDFINDNDDADLLDVEFPTLKLSNCSTIDDWITIVIDHFNRLFDEVKSDATHGALTQILDILDMIVSESFSGKVLLCFAEMGEASGNYLFFQGDNEEYLVLNFLYHN